MENVDGTTGPHWTLEQTERVREHQSFSYDPHEFWIAMNMIYSDYAQVFKTYGVWDKIYLYADMAKAFLEDKDAVGGGGAEKLSAYYNAVVKH